MPCRCLFVFIIDKMVLQTVTNHPVHILNDEGNFSPSSFVPFCSFGGKFLGKKIDGFEIPVCDIFKPRTYLDQHCYETNLQHLKDSNNQKLEKQLETGLTLVIDYNEERQSYKHISKNQSYVMKPPYQKDDSSFSVFLDAISISNFKTLYVCLLCLFCIVDPVGLFGEGQYNLHSMKEISVTDSFMGLDRHIRKCLNIETHDDCKT